ncbi:hypothetical protein IP88_11835 [alpha proteobacterium AAP81b]|nr:hypothetical protein IP88_11835 [alpha proteobacterium AAP81b]
MTREYEWEPVRGLPERLPSGEEILWQGSPDWRAVAGSVLHIRAVALWFVAVAGFAFVSGGTGVTGALLTLLAGVVGCGIVAGLAWAQARTTVYTLTARRVVLRFGVALTKCVNLPLSMIASADAKPAGFGCHDLALATTDHFPLGYVQMWPHVRPGRFANPVPMLRGLDDRAMSIVANALAQASVSRQRVAVTNEATAAPHAMPVGVAA